MCVSFNAIGVPVLSITGVIRPSRLDPLGCITRYRERVLIALRCRFPVGLQQIPPHRHVP